MYSSLTYGKLTEEETFKQIVYNISLIKREKYDYELSVGTDSQSYKKSTVVTSILLRKKTKGGIFFRTKSKIKRFDTLQQKIIEEVNQAITVAIDLRKYLRDAGFSSIEIYDNLFVDVDVGPNGKTSELIQMTTGWVKGMGFRVRIKPDSIAASRVSDKYSKRGGDRTVHRPHVRPVKIIKAT